MTDDDIFDDLFLGCALAAFIDQAIEQLGPPDMEATRRRAYRLYESELAEKNAGKSPTRHPQTASPSSA